MVLHILRSVGLSPEIEKRGAEYRQPAVVDRLGGFPRPAVRGVIGALDRLRVGAAFSSLESVFQIFLGGIRVALDCLDGLSRSLSAFLQLGDRGDDGGVLRLGKLF